MPHKYLILFVFICGGGGGSDNLPHAITVGVSNLVARGLSA